jgi:hypothetical protein
MCGTFIEFISFFVKDVKNMGTRQNIFNVLTITSKIWYMGDYELQISY